MFFLIGQNANADDQVSGAEEMAQRAATFHFSPTPMGGSGDYLEFPRDADPILRVIYQLRGVSEGGSPPDLEQGAPSTISSSAASNSDSGIGGRDTDALLPQVIVMGVKHFT